MTKYKHLISGLFIICVYYLNSQLINYGLKFYIDTTWSNFTAAQIAEFSAQYPTDQMKLVAFYVLVFKAMFISYTIILGIITIVCRRTILSKIRSIANNLNYIIKRMLFYIAVMIGITLCLFIINYFTHGEVNPLIGDNQSMINLVLLENPNIYAILVVGLLAPLFEEYIFRYGIINKLLKNRSSVTKVLLSSVLFTYIHIGIDQIIGSPIISLNLVVAYMPMALIYSFVYVREKNIAFPIILHILNNIGSIIMILYFTN